MALQRRDLPAALERWHAVRQQFPDRSAGYIGEALAQREMRQFDESETLLREAIQLFPQEPSPLVEFAWAALYRRDWPETVRRWGDVRERVPQHPGGYTNAAAGLRELERFDEAETLLRTAAEKFPEQAAPATELARLAQARRDWPAAIQRWEAVRQRFPDLREGYFGGAQCLREADRPDEAEAGTNHGNRTLSRRSQPGDRACVVCAAAA